MHDRAREIIRWLFLPNWWTAK